MKKKRVALIFGGKSGEHEVSIVSALSIYAALDKNKYDITMIGIDKTGRWTLPDPSQVLSYSKNPRLLKLNQVAESIAPIPYEHNKSLLAASDATKPSTSQDARFDVVLPILHGTYGEDGTIQGLLELANLPYAGSGVLGSSVGMDKDLSKRLFQAAQIPVVPSLVFHKHEFKKSSEAFITQAEKTFGYPYFVKPANMGSSVGVAKIKNREAAIEKINAAFDYDTKILIEKAIAARELECAVLGYHEPRASIIGEIIPKHEFYSYEAKYIDENGADLKIPAEGLSAETISKLQEYSILAFRAIECRGMARVDFFMDKTTGEIYLNEVNTIPGFTQISMYPKLWAASGVPYSQLLDEIIELALAVHREKNELKTSFE